MSEFEIDPLFELIDDLEIDEKTDALLRELVSGGRCANLSSLVVLTEFSRTARYLGVAFEQAGLSAQVLHGGCRRVETDRVIESFRQNAGVLVATSVAIDSFDLSKAQAVVHYDIPKSQRALDKRRVTYGWFTRTTPVMEIFLRDQSGVIPDEEQALAALDVLHP